MHFNNAQIMIMQLHKESTPIVQKITTEIRLFSYMPGVMKISLP